MFRQMLFVVLSFCDLILTWWLLTSYELVVYESNPVANWILLHFGWAGLFLLKVAGIAVMLYTYRRIKMARPRTASVVLSFGCLVLASVVSYSIYLTQAAGPWNTQLVELHTEKDKLHQKANSLQRHVSFMNQLTDQLIADRLCLPEAVKLLEQSERAAEDWQWIKRLQQLYECDTRTIALAATLLEHVKAEVDYSRSVSEEEVFSRLKGQFAAAYGADVKVPTLMRVRARVRA